MEATERAAFRVTLPSIRTVLAGFLASVYSAIIFALVIVRKEDGEIQEDSGHCYRLDLFLNFFQNVMASWRYAVSV